MEAQPKASTCHSLARKRGSAFACHCHADAYLFAVCSVQSCLFIASSPFVYTRFLQSPSSSGRTMSETTSTGSSPPCESASPPVTRTTAPQVFCVTSYATMPSFSTLPAGAQPASSATVSSKPVQINLQAHLQPLVSAAVQQTVWNLQPAHLSTISSAPNSSTPSLLAASSQNPTQSAAPAVASSLLGESVSELAPDSLRDNELPREFLLEHQHLVIPKRPPSREIRDIITWIDCWIAYCQVVLSFSPARSVELLKYLDLIVRAHRSFPSADVWLRYDRGFRRKAACSSVPLDWGSTFLEVFHQSYASSNVLQSPSTSGQSFRRSGELLRGGEAQSSPSAAEICRTWNNGHCTSGFAVCRRRHECSVCHGLHRSTTCSTHSARRRSRSRSPPRGRAR